MSDINSGFVSLGKQKCMEQITNTASCLRFIEYGEGRCILHYRDILRDAHTGEIEYTDWKPVEVLHKKPEEKTI